MNIETELTPNPETLKFIVENKYIFQSGIEIKDKKEAKKFKFSKNLFQLKGVKRMFIGENFIAVTKEKSITWNYLKTKILIFILDFVTSNKYIVEKIIKKEPDKNINRNKISSKIEKIINDKVRPAVARDGGDIIFKNFEKGIVYLNLKGACVGCPSSTATLKQGIENLLKRYLPEVKEVKAI